MITRNEIIDIANTYGFVLLFHSANGNDILYWVANIFDCREQIPFIVFFDDTDKVYECSFNGYNRAQTIDFFERISQPPIRRVLFEKAI